MYVSKFLRKPHYSVLKASFTISREEGHMSLVNTWGGGKLEVFRMHLEILNDAQTARDEMSVHNTKGNLRPALAYKGLQSTRHRGGDSISLNSSMHSVT